MVSLGSTWPSMTFESVMWDVHPDSGRSRADVRRLGTPYRAAVTPDIADLEVRVSSQVAAEAEEAAMELRAFDAEMGAAVAPFALVLLRSESAASSQIENLSASARAIAEAEINGSGSEHAELIVANVRAMTAALSLAERLDEDAVLAMHAALMSASDADIAGRWRTDQVWIGGRAFFGPGSPHDATFVPPVAERVPAAMADLMRFARRIDLPVVPQVAILHAQFETIHPFVDGNGRTGRALMHAALRGTGVTRHISVPISTGLLTDTPGYFRALTDYRDGDIDAIVSCVARAALIGVVNGRGLVAELREVRVRWEDSLSGLRSDSAARRLADGLLRHPVIYARLAREILGIRRNEHRHIDALVERSILVGHTDHKTRNRTWRAPEVLGALDRYAARSGRRSLP